MNIKDTLHPYFYNRTTNYLFKPNEEVYVPHLEFKKGKDINDLRILGKVAYRTREVLIQESAWATKAYQPYFSVVKMTTEEFLNKVLSRYPHDNIVEFAKKYEQKYNIKLNIKNRDLDEESEGIDN